MSTRANIILKDGIEELIFYKHCDGYPDGTLPLLQKFLDWVKTGKIRDNIVQASGWLILLGADTKTVPQDGFDGGKCGDIEPTTHIHGDIEYLYVVDLIEKVIHTNGYNGYRYAGQFEQPCRT